MNDEQEPIRVATFNTSLNRSEEGALIADLSTPDDEQAQAIAEIIRINDPDVILLNEFDFDPDGEALANFQENYLGEDAYPFQYLAPSNTGVLSGADFNGDGEVSLPADAFGFGFFPGQFGMALLSKLPIVEEAIRTFQTFRWIDMPGARLPDDPATPEPGDFYSAEALEVFRLSSKSHWDVPVEVDGEIVHILAAHPTPPVFDGPEDFNGLRNADEIRFFADYVTPGEGDYIYDDAGEFGGLAAGSRFVIVGDYNADPFDGDSTDEAARQFTENPLIDNSPVPTSRGGVEAALIDGGVNITEHVNNPSRDTADFSEPPGNLRVDYALPSEAGLEIVDAQVYWPETDEPGADLVTFSDHRLAYVDLNVLPGETPAMGPERAAVEGLELLGEATFATGTSFEGTEFGGVSGLAYDAEAGVYYALSDDRSGINDARFYTLTIDLGADGALDEGDVEIVGVTTLLNGEGEPFPSGGIDPEGIALGGEGDALYVASEGDTAALLNPFVNAFTLDGAQTEALPVPERFNPTEDGSVGVRNNLAFESLTISPDGETLTTATENALVQDGPAASLDEGTRSRVVQYGLSTGEVAAEYVYETDGIAAAPEPADGFATNGLVELLALDNSGTFLALERSFSVGIGIRLFEARAQGATDVQSFEAIADRDGEPFDIDAPLEKDLLLDLGDLGLTLDNAEALAFGPDLPDGRKLLVVASDNNFSETQVTQFLAFGVEVETIPTVEATLETRDQIRYEDFDAPLDELSPENDPDDPAIYVAPDPANSVVITTLKNAGFTVNDLDGAQIQLESPEGVRFNNVDLVYGVDGQDLAVFSDRANDTLAIYRIDPESGALADVTGAVPASIFGVDDGEATAYGLATYQSPVDGRVYAFVTQADGAAVAQVELTPGAGGAVDAAVVRVLDLPVPTGDPADSQSEGIVIDQEYGVGYVALEDEVGILRFEAEPGAGDDLTPIYGFEDGPLVPDLEGLDLYYADEGRGFLLASSQGDATFGIFDRETNEYLGRFAIGEGAVDAVEESDGLDVVNAALPGFPSGLLVTQDGSNEPAAVEQDPEDGEIQNFSANFKYTDPGAVAEAFDLRLDTEAFDPRNPADRTADPDRPGGTGNGGGAGSDTLPNGVASGDVSQDSIVLWTRSTQPGEVTFEVTADGAVVATATAEVTDPLLPVKVVIEGLAPGTEHAYAVTDAAGTTKTGEFATAAPLGEQNGLTFGVAGDWRGEQTPYPAIENADEQDLAFFVQAGDTINADTASPALPQPQAVTLEEFFLKHEEVYSEFGGLNAWGELRASTPVFATIDDHEVIDNFSGGAPISSDPRFAPFGAPGDFINDSALYENGLTAFQAYNPIRDLFYEDTGANPAVDGERQIYRFETFGSDAALIVTDARSFRDAPIEDAVDPADVPAFFQASFDPSRTLLGEPQVDLLLNDLQAADEAGVTWKFVLVPEPTQLISPAFGADRFEGYLAERERILNFVEEQGIDNVVFVSGDIHGTFVNNLTRIDPATGEAVATDVFEVTTGPVSVDPPAGPGLIQAAFALGLITEEQLAVYEDLPVAPDADDVPDDKDDFVKQAFNEAFAPLGYDPLGLDDNLPQTEGRIDATLIQGDYVVAHTYNWTEFDIDAETQALTVTTYGVPAYTPAEAQADPEAIAALEPEIVSRFVVNPQPDDADGGIGGGGGGGVPTVLPNLEESRPLDPSEILTVPTESFSVPVDTEVFFTFLGKTAALDSALGFYTVDADGVIGEGAIIAPSTDALSPGQSFAFEVEAGVVYGAFLVPGNRLPDLSIFEEGGLFFVDEDGEAATLSTPTPRVVDGEGNPVGIAPLHVLDGNGALPGNPLNPGGSAQATAGITTDPNSGTPIGVVAIEDLIDNADADFNDAVAAFSLAPLAPPVVADLIEDLGLPPLGDAAA